MIYLHICASNDTNGNPRRCFVVVDDTGEVLDAIDEGYSGNREVTKKWPGASQGPRINVSVKEYKSFLKEFGS